MEKSFPKIESELSNSRPDGFLSHVCVYSHFSHYLQNRQERYLAFDKKKIKMDAVKNLGSYPAEVRFMEGISAKITIVVEGL